MKNEHRRAAEVEVAGEIGLPSIHGDGVVTTKPKVSHVTTQVTHHQPKAAKQSTRTQKAAFGAEEGGTGPFSVSRIASYRQVHDHRHKAKRTLEFHQHFTKEKLHLQFVIQEKDKHLPFSQAGL